VGVASQAHCAIDWDLFLCLLVGTCLVFPSHEVMLPMLAVLMLQWQIIGRIDDVMQLVMSKFLKNACYPFTLHIKMCWSKSIASKNQSPTQMLFGLMDPHVCPFLNLAVYFESCWEDTHSRGKLFPKQTNQGILIFLGTIFESEHFPLAHTVGKLGTHSICKGAAAYARCNGITKEWISQRWRWKGIMPMVKTYIGTYQVCFFINLPE
jgi:hypothetical protein